MCLTKNVMKKEMKEEKCNRGMMHTTANNRTWDSRGQTDAEAAERKSGQGQKMNRYLSFLFLI